MPKKIYQYGYDIKKISKQIYRPKNSKKRWGYSCKIFENDKYALAHIFIRQGKSFLFKPPVGKESSVYLEEGEFKNLKAQSSILIPSGVLKKPLKLESAKDSHLYIFSGPLMGRMNTLKRSKLFNFHNQYWADLVWTIVNRQYCGKKIFLKKGNNSSFHFHCKKSETYFVHSGKLFLRIRAGKGEDRFFVLNKGQAVDIPPGLIHQAGGLEDTIIMEVSTKDSDGDAFLVESEFTKMPKLKK